MKIDIIIAYIQRYEFGHERDFVPPITGIHLAAITPAKHQVRVFHQQVDEIDLDTDADLIAISFLVALHSLLTGLLWHLEPKENSWLQAAHM